MRRLADTNIVIWYLAGSSRLSRAARAAIEPDASEIVFSVISAFELLTKAGLDKLDVAPEVRADVRGTLMAHGFTPLLLQIGEAELAGRLPRHHQDPFDRLIIAQALIHGLPVVTSDAIFEAYGVRRIW